ncbi:MAG TPA: hypothetical protein VG126_14665, partial [Thermoleophilaceae bacterium]|nr:hypothetical protein [Thermoleophilaceae bacterium]
RAGPEVPAAVAEPGAEPGPSGELRRAGKDRAFRNRSDSASRDLARELLAMVEEADGGPHEEVLERLRRRLAEEAPPPR